ncbi:MAG: leucyl aminopeptidase [Rhodocyclaceae bacterium]|uniref:Probable cytosol aminopeptidase n=1 Tax=Candidatus Desulfobacillus denitrificans TaxID=2608985 RepID=A0A809R4G3_9PROT|nr:leucyl aminopeptidase [Zoogloeaceae bacterium]MBP9653614.1 leucyl aminopeptidase [Rhodocyclaceae bacterium]MCZ2173672.1 leucyl aminopeptidase [Burkholderiales bacterium]OQY72248.1 MAG: leucyl aminopeptidase [Rhodocyclaceae bacterium UTPRO2]BBO21598.1 leucyl aminopeptidase [Candidatus Desulfobacillus denitrificans]GIK46433.1 MAG: putative cytosol aminopeptidase [Betaproteobacteria bacterium]
MEFSIKSLAPEKARCDCIVVGVFDSRKLSEPAQRLDKAAGGHLAGILRRGDMEGKAGATLLVHGAPRIAAERVLLVGLGKEAEFGEKAYREAVAATVRTLKGGGSKNVVVTLSELPVAKRSAAWRVRQGALAVNDVLYRPDQLKSKKENGKPGLAAIAFSVAGKDARPAAAALAQGAAIAQGMDLTRELGNLPANICTPSYLAQQARKLAKEFGLKCEVLDRARMERLGMGSLLSVARGSHQPPRFIVLQYQGGKAGTKPVVLVGKGITFDTGGISLKPGAEMDEMKYDMSGAASVLGTFRALAAMKLPLNVVGLIPTTENMPGGAATRPGDIVTSMSGQTIEILNTDAEGRLILCDALTYAERFDPECVVDVATLTGACVIALGAVASGLLANDDGLAAELLEAGQASGDRAWQLPLWDDYQEMLKSNFADIPNISGSRAAGTITGACFLARFTKQYRWAHLDIAGTAWRSGKEKGSTGRPVPLLTHFLLKRAGKL